MGQHADHSSMETKWSECVLVWWFRAALWNNANLGPMPAGTNT
jgi:hypothetical protein